jgi:hypothetical protein
MVLNKKTALRKNKKSNSRNKKPYLKNKKSYSKNKKLYSRNKTKKIKKDKKKQSGGSDLEPNNKQTNSKNGNNNVSPYMGKNGRPITVPNEVAKSSPRKPSNLNPFNPIGEGRKNPYHY